MKNQGQNQKKNNLKGWYENIEGQTWISMRKERKKGKKKKECRWCIKGPMSTRVIHEEREGWDESTNEGGGATNVCNTHVNSFLHSFSKTSSYLHDPCIITKKKTHFEIIN